MKKQLLGHHVTTQAEGAIPNGQRIRKCFSEAGDGNPIGTLGRVVGSMGPLDIPEFPDSLYGYFVEWDTFPGVAVFVAGKKIERAG
jgi:hypothetical protein